MKTALCKSVLTLAASFALAACSNDSRSADDVLAEDSTLALEVMTANVDSTQIQADTAAPLVELAPENVPPAEPAEVSAPVAAPAPVIAQESPEPKVVRRSAPRRVRKPPSRARPATVRVASRSSTTSAARPIPSTPMKSSATIPSGTELSLTSGQHEGGIWGSPGLEERGGFTHFFRLCSGGQTQSSEVPGIPQSPALSAHSDSVSLRGPVRRTVIFPPSGMQ